MSRDLCAALKEMADNMAPSQQLLSEVERIIDRLTSYLRDRRFSWGRYVDRVVPHGSFAKKTSLRNMMDLDIVVFLNDIEHPFGDFMNALHEHILLNDSYKNCSRYEKLLVFVAEGIPVDLIPATNRIPRNENSQGREAQELQHKNTLRFIMNSPDPFDAGWKECYGLAETSVEFVRRKNELYHASTIARLAKFWSKTICVEGFHSGRSSIMEYIAIRAAELEQSDSRENTLKSFRRFLVIVSKPEEMSIYWKDFYRDQDIDPQIKRQRPLLLNPRNPYHNVLGDRNQGFMKEMARFARVSLERLNEAECQALQGQRLDMLELFKPQPEWLRLPFIIRRSARKPGRFWVGAIDGGNLVMAKCTINSQKIHDQEKEVIENFLFSFSEVSVVHSKKMGVNVAQRVQREVQDMLVPNTRWVPGPEPANADAKLEIPFDDEYGRKKVLRVYFDMI